MCHEGQWQAGACAEAPVVVYTATLFYPPGAEEDQVGALMAAGCQQLRISCKYTVGQTMEVEPRQCPWD